MDLSILQLKGKEKMVGRADCSAPHRRKSIVTWRLLSGGRGGGGVIKEESGEGYKKWEGLQIKVEGFTQGFP